MKLDCEGAIYIEWDEDRRKNGMEDGVNLLLTRSEGGFEGELSIAGFCSDEIA